MDWYNRQSAEINESVKQIIPYLILHSVFDDKIGIYERAGNEQRLHGLYSIGVGGHINPQDARVNESIMSTIIRSAKRELSEELINPDPEYQLDFRGIINEERTKVGRTHIGLVFLIELDSKPQPGEELKNLQWIERQHITHKMELWSEMALELLNI